MRNYRCEHRVCEHLGLTQITVRPNEGAHQILAPAPGLARQEADQA